MIARMIRALEKSEANYTDINVALARIDALERQVAELRTDRDDDLERTHEIIDAINGRTAGLDERIALLENLYDWFRNRGTQLDERLGKVDRVYDSYASLHKRIGQLDRVLKAHGLGLNSLNHLVAGQERETRLRFEKVESKFSEVTKAARGLAQRVSGLESVDRGGRPQGV